MWWWISCTWNCSEPFCSSPLQGRGFSMRGRDRLIAMKTLRPRRPELQKSVVGMGGNWRYTWAAEKGAQPGLQAIHVDIHDRRGEEREHLTEDQAADDGDAEGLADFRARAGTQCQRQCTKHRRHRGHHNRAETHQCGSVNRSEEHTSEL